MKCVELSSLTRAQGQYDLAKPLYERSIQVRENALGADHPGIASSLNDLGESMRVQVMSFEC